MRETLNGQGTPWASKRKALTKWRSPMTSPILLRECSL
jgi:hypothetical protein